MLLFWFPVLVSDYLPLNFGIFISVWSRLSGKSVAWERGYHQLPQGYFRVVVEATSGKGTEQLNIAIDDIWIGECERGKRYALCSFKN